MSTAVQRRRGTTAQHASFAGLEGELTVDTTKDTLVIHDGSTAGGRPLLREDQSNLPTSAPTTGIYNASGSLAISTGGSGKLFVDASGRVGVGTTPSYTLHLTSTETATNVVVDNPNRGGFITTFRNAGAIGGIGNVGALLGNTTEDFAVYAASGKGTRFYTDGTIERLRITSAGLVGVGTSAPVAALDVNGRIAVVAGTTGTPSYHCNTDTNTGINLPEGDRIQFVTGGVEAVRIDSSQRVGIGTTSPLDRFHVNAGGNYPAYSNLIYGSSADFESTLYLNAYGPGANCIIANALTETLTIKAGYATSGNIVFNCRGTERAKIDSSGRLLVGTSTSPTVGDPQYGLIRIQGNTSSASGFGLLSIGRGQAASSITSGSELGHIYFTSNDGSPYASVSAYSDAAGGTNDYPGRLVFSTCPDSGSSPVERMRLSANGNLNVPAVYSFTGPVSANVGVDSDGLLFRATSSITYKKDVETLADSYADAILSCRPVWYRAKEAPSTLPSDWGYWGFIAEEVAEIDPRLVQWKTTKIVQSDDGSLGSVACEPTPDGVQYDRFVPHLLNLIKRQGEAIADLQAEVAALKAQ